MRVNLELPLHQPASQGHTSSNVSIAANIRAKISSFLKSPSTTSRQSITPSMESPKLLPPPPRLGLSRISSLSIRIPSYNTPAPLTPRSPSSTRSMIDATPSPASHVFPLPELPSQTGEEVLSSPRRLDQDTQLENPEAERAEQGVEPNIPIEGFRHKRLQKLKERGRSTSAVLRHKEIRQQTTCCAVLGIILSMFVATYLALALSNTAAGPDFHILFILAIMILSIFFCYASGRLLKQLIRPPRYEDPSGQGARGSGSSSDVVAPEQPIAVVLARDEEEGFDVEEEDDQSPKEVSIRPPPPVYGLWNDTVKMNPNFVHWRRRVVTTEVVAAPSAASEEAAPRIEILAGNEEPSSSSSPAAAAVADRPPSYLSDDGVQYVLEAQPRSTVASQQQAQAVRSPRRDRIRMAVNMLAFR